MIEAYLSELWCPERPMVGPVLRVERRQPLHPEFRWVRQLDLAVLRQMPYADVLEAIRTA